MRFNIALSKMDWRVCLKVVTQENCPNIKKRKKERNRNRKKSLQKNYNEVQRRPRVDIHGMATDTFREWWGIKTKWQQELIYNDGDWWRLLTAAVRNVEMWRSDRVDSSFKGEKKEEAAKKQKAVQCALIETSAQSRRRESLMCRQINLHSFVAG